MPSLKFCALTPSDAATQVKRMRGHAPSQQAAHTFWMNLLTLGQIQQNQRLEIDSQGMFRLESTASRKLNTLSPFRSASRSINELHPAVLAVLHRAQIECFYPTPQVCNVLGRNIDFSQFVQHRSSQRRHSDAVLQQPAGFGQITQEIAAAAHEISVGMKNARAGLNNMLAGYRSQNSFYNKKDTQIASVDDLVLQADPSTTTLFVLDDKVISIAKVINLKAAITKNPQLWHGPWSTRAEVEATRSIIVRGLYGAIAKNLILHGNSSQCSLLLWGHHKLRGEWAYEDIQEPFFSDVITDKDKHTARNYYFKSDSPEHCWDKACRKDICDLNAVDIWRTQMERKYISINKLFKALNEGLKSMN